MTVADPDDALIEAIAEAGARHGVFADGNGHVLCRCDNSGWMTWKEYRQHSARAAYAAMVEHLGLTEETRTLDDGMAGQVWTEGFPTWPDITIVSRRATRQRRIVSRWTEVDHGSE